MPAGFVEVGFAALEESNVSASDAKTGDEKTGESMICGVVRRGDAVMIGDDI